MATTPKTGSTYTYTADSTTQAEPALASLTSGTEVTVRSADKDQIRIGWRDAQGANREAPVPASTFATAFTQRT